MPIFAITVCTTSDTTDGGLADFNDPVTQWIITRMDVFNALLVAFGNLIDSGCFFALTKGVEIKFAQPPRPIVGAFTSRQFQCQSLISAFWLINAANYDEAVVWSNRIPCNTDNWLVKVKECIVDSEGRYNRQDLLVGDLMQTQGNELWLKSLGILPP